MENILDFIVNNWKVLVFACCFLVEIILIIISLFKKRVKVADDISSVLLQLPQFINDAESSGLSGSDKLALVFRKCLELLEISSGLSVSTLMAKYGDLILDSIEAILSTPKKKEVHYEKENE